MDIIKIAFVSIGLNAACIVLPKYGLDNLF